MKFLLFTIFLGAAYASTLDPQNQGEWRLKIVAATNKDKVAEGGALSVFLKKIFCQDEKCHKIGFIFNAKEGGKCKSFSLVGEKAEHDDRYIADYEGKNYFTVCYQSEKVIITCTKNIDENGVETDVIEVAVKLHYELTEEGKAAFLRLLKEHGISESNVVNVSQEDAKRYPDYSGQRNIISNAGIRNQTSTGIAFQIVLSFLEF